MLKRKAIFGWALAGAALAGAMLFPARTLEVRCRQTGRVIFRDAASPGERFTFAYIHSVENIPVEGIFAVEADGMLRVVETRFASYGTGLPVPDAGRSFDGKWLVAPGGQRLPEFSFLISPINRASLRIGNTTLDLNRLVESGDVVEVAVRSYPFLLTRLRLIEAK